MNYIVDEETIQEAWIQASKIVFEKGIEQSTDEEIRKEIINLGVFIRDCTKNGHKKYFKHFGHDVYDRVANLYKPEGGSQRFGYSYSDRIYNYHGVDQIKQVVDLLSEKPDSNSAIITLLDPSSNKDHVPCVMNLVFKIRDGKLLMWILFKSSDIAKKLVPDVVSLLEIHASIARKLNVKQGSLKAFILSAQVYKEDYETIKKYTEG